MADIPLFELYRNWDRINDKISEVFDRDDLLFGIDPIDSRAWLGEGKWGIVYPTNETGWVLKVSGDEAEGRIVRSIISHEILRDHPGIAYILGAWRVELGDKDHIVILREDIKPIPNKRAKTREEKALGRYLDGGRRIAESMNIAQIEYRNEMPWRVAWLDYLKDMKNDPQLFEVADFMYTFTNVTRYAPADIHAGNLGYRISDLSYLGLDNHLPGDYYVTFDIGHSSFGGRETLPPIENPGRPLPWI